MAENGAVITTENLSVRYGPRPAIEGVSLSVRRGSVLTVVGPSGCGKSSFLSALNRLTDLIPTATVEGRILFDGQDIRDAFPSPAQLRRHVGMIFQKPNPFAMSVRRNLHLPLREHGYRDRKERDRITESALRDAGLWDEVSDRLDRSALELSGGQQQRLCIARAIALQPQVLLMDEPCSALDPIAAERIETLIRNMGGRYTVVVVTHNLAQARRLADDVAVFWLQDGVGRVIESGPVETVFASPQSDTARSYLTGQRG